MHEPPPQPSARFGSHIAHPTPFVPHAAALGITQVSPEQQPVGQLAGEQPLQTPLLHFPPKQTWQLDPPVPHAIGEVPPSHVVPEQQPFGHDVWLQTQLPLTQICCGPHAAPPPQVHAPPVLHPSPACPQVVHVPPAVPQAAGVCVSQTLPLQQPFGHDASLHTHCDPTHACPVVHAAPDPQLHVPPLHPSARVLEHCVHCAPPEPQSAAVTDVVQTVPSQHPPGHELSSHTQALFTHSWPAVQAGPLPHWHRPVVEHPSAVVLLHSLHDSPPVPHAASDGWLHVGPVQHPLVHVSTHPEQRPSPVQVCPDGQEPQTLPPVPHAVIRLPGWHDSPLQQPEGQPMPSHTHLPPRQCCPDAHAAPPPQEHEPAALQLSESTSSQAVQPLPEVPHAVKAGDSHVSSAPQQPFAHDVLLQRQTPLMHTCPTPQGAPVPHVHSPVMQPSDVPDAHALQVAPARPHAEGETTSSHVVPSQHPSGHEAASQMQSPPTHACPPLHAGLPPHVHSPVVEHASDRVLSHATQTAPPTPQVASPDDLHSVPEQHPSAQLVAHSEHTPPVHIPTPQSEQR